MLLTWNEEPNIADCLASLARQRERDFDVVVVDAASTDRTAAVVRELQRGFPVPLHLDVAARRLSIGEARNRGVALARAPAIAFVSADAELDEAWVGEALSSLERHDLVFGRQVHDPRRWTLGAAVRGLRYHYPDGIPPDPLRYASNVAAAYRIDVLRSFPFDAEANAAEDLVLARRAAAHGSRAAYNPRMVVHHHDVATARDELRKNVREGQGWARYRGELGLRWPLLAWGATVVLAAALLALRPGVGTGLLAAALVWLPALRRAVRRRHAMPPWQILKGVAASPAFDVVFLLNYVYRLPAGARRRGPIRTPQEARA